MRTIESFSFRFIFSSSFKNTLGLINDFVLLCLRSPKHVYSYIRRRKKNRRNYKIIRSLDTIKCVNILNIYV